MVWYSHLSQNLPQFIVIHTVRDFGVINKVEIDVFLELSCFFHDPVDVGLRISLYIAELNFSYFLIPLGILPLSGSSVEVWL